MGSRLVNGIQSTLRDNPVRQVTSITAYTRSCATRKLANNPPSFGTSRAPSTTTVISRNIFIHTSHILTTCTAKKIHTSITRKLAKVDNMRTSDAMASHVLHSRPVKRVCDDLEKPLLDDRSYRVIKLGNDLEALLIHDPKEDKAAAAMDVNVGNFSDPEDMPGMAHAVEHLLFMGTEKVSHNWRNYSLTGVDSNSTLSKTTTARISRETAGTLMLLLLQLQQTTTSRFPPGSIVLTRPSPRRHRRCLVLWIASHSSSSILCSSKTRWTVS